MKTKFKVFILCTLMFIMPCSVSAAENYIVGDAKILNQGVIDICNTNFAKLEGDTGAKARILIITSLDDNDLNSKVSELEKNMHTDKFAIFIIAEKEHKSKLLIGKRLNSIFNSTEIKRITTASDNYIKKQDFNTGTLEANCEVTKDITLKTFKDEKEVENRSLPGKKHSKLIIIISTLTILTVILAKCKRRGSKAYTRC